MYHRCPFDFFNFFIFIIVRDEKIFFSPFLIFFFLFFFILLFFNALKLIQFKIINTEKSLLPLKLNEIKKIHILILFPKPFPFIFYVHLPYPTVLST